MLPLPMIDVTCDDCGACCRHVGTPPGFALYFPVAGQLTPEWGWQNEDGLIIAAMPEDVYRELRDYYAAVDRGEVADRTQDDATPCLWFDEGTKRCRHHAHRPSICREFPVGDEDCLKFRQQWGVDDDGE